MQLIFCSPRRCNLDRGSKRRYKRVHQVFTSGWRAARLDGKTGEMRFGIDFIPLRSVAARHLSHLYPCLRLVPFRALLPPPPPPSPRPTSSLILFPRFAFSLLLCKPLTSQTCAACHIRTSAFGKRLGERERKLRSTISVPFRPRARGRWRAASGWLPHFSSGTIFITAEHGLPATAGRNFARRASPSGVSRARARVRLRRRLNSAGENADITLSA